MGVYWQGLVEAIRLLLSGDREVLEVILRTLHVSGTATIIGVMIGIPLGTFIALVSFPGRRLTISIINLGMGLPPVVVGLWVWLTLSRYGPLGLLGLLYTPTAMITAQVIIAAPIIAGFTIAAIQSLNPKIKLQILALGASRLQLLLLLLREARLGLLAAIIAGFGGAISEVGASMMVGGNLKGSTMVLTTATVLSVNKGSYEMATALSIILLLLAFGVTVVLTVGQQRGR
ncbi:MAG: Sulfate transport system permease protein CysW [Pelotomaculum sp. PtaB.Bin013]|uniref:ABC transporter permease n=1 Tax=Pelotomaculum isophthalicicum JI TaxID=947010 RepID=A0A9X4GZU2_9FIRM|nr:ABC transporter permease [Pelotomaculum isophthalicicum]MDF9409172.1 ABC transporter permease [Pelotomaculum isophthalicicum JI]OPX90324.1 MAG: Sulfate transport system permease protein CysW [Pelotomaculum sp. PtaB.Bin013]